MKILNTAIATLLFVILLLVVYYIHISFFRVNVVFYAAAADGGIAACITGFILILAKYFKDFNYFEKFQLVIIWLLLGYCSAISIPTVIDRSLSLYILEKLQQRGGGIMQTSFEEVFRIEYVKEHRLVDVRLTEQLESGTIIIKDGCVRLTAKGDSVATVSRYFRMHFLPKKRLLMGEYTDDLTDPFRNRSDNQNYTCR